MAKMKCQCTLSKCTHPNQKCDNGPLRPYVTQDFDLMLCFDCLNNRAKLSGPTHNHGALLVSVSKRNSGTYCGTCQDWFVPAGRRDQ
jgi:hypothetical protein